jgi:D-glycero-D-manno-heptose 1,7-bisphosphate phosphatase
VAVTRAVFLDKDGTLLVDVPYNVDPELMRLAPKAGDGLQVLEHAGYRLIVVSNQSGVARGLFSAAEVGAMEVRLRLLLEEHGVTLDGFFYCPHHPHGSVAEYAIECSCRKPEPGLLVTAAGEQGIELDRSWMIGDILDDVEAGNRAGCRTVLVDSGNETEWALSRTRMPEHVVADLEQAAAVIVALDQTTTEPGLARASRGER